MSQFYAKLNEMIIQENIEEARKSLESIKLSDLPENSPVTLLHLAAQQGNVEMTNLLLHSKQNINAQDPYGITPILVASVSKNFEIVDILLDNQADIFIANSRGLTLLESLMENKKIVPTNTFEKFFGRLKNSGIGVENIVSKLQKSNCPLDLVLLIKYPEVTRAMINITNSIYPAESFALVSRTMELVDLENLEVLLKHGVRVDTRQCYFIKILSEQLEDVKKNMKTLDIFLKNMIKWDIFIERREFVDNVRRIFEDGSEEEIRVLLECDLHNFVTKKLGFNLITYLFSNANIKVTKLLKNIRFDSNALNQYGWSALETSIQLGHADDVKFLLDFGADPNRNACRLNYKPMRVAFAVLETKCVHLLLHYGADVFSTNIREEKMILKNDQDYKPLRAKYALNLIQNLKIEKIQLPSDIQDYVDNCCKQVEWTKTQKITGSLTIFDILVKSAESLECRLQDKNIMSKIMAISQEENLDPYYLSALENKLANVRLIHECKPTVTEFLLDVIGWMDKDHLVFNKIIGYLELKDFLFLS